MDDILLKNIAHLVTFDDDEHELKNVDLLIRKGIIESIGVDIAAEGDVEVMDATSLIVLPGLINGHHHLYQVGLRAFPELERTNISLWLAGLHARTYEYWNKGLFTPESVGLVAKAGMVESLLGGVTTVADQHYVFPGGVSDPYIESMIESAIEVGIRLHAGRGSMTLGQTYGGVVADEVCQRIDDVLSHAEDLIAAYHDPDPLAQIRIDLAPCGVHVDRPEMYEEFAAMADRHPGVGLHTHLYQHVDTQFCFDTYGMTPWQMLGERGWHKPGVWLAHVVDPPVEEIPAFAATGVGIVHVVAPDLRMGWGLAPIRAYLDAGCKLGFGTTGSASNDGCNQLGDIRLAALAHRMTDSNPEQWPSIRELLRLSTRGSADCLSRPLLGRIAAGMGADLACWNLNSVDRVGVHDPVIGLILTGLSDRCELVIVGGKIVVRDGHCTTINEQELVASVRAAMPIKV
jgi:cytosine/adenosine deaminase-related metal-dependent hydrolase